MEKQYYCLHKFQHSSADIAWILDCCTYTYDHDCIFVTRVGMFIFFANLIHLFCVCFLILKQNNERKKQFKTKLWQCLACYSLDRERFFFENSPHICYNLLFSPLTFCFDSICFYFTSTLLFVRPCVRPVIRFVFTNICFFFQYSNTFFKTTYTHSHKNILKVEEYSSQLANHVLKPPPPLPPPPAAAEVVQFAFTV